MNTLLDSLAGRDGYILWKRYWAVARGDGKFEFFCLLRFVVDGWSSVILRSSSSRHLAGSSALRAYVEFASRVGFAVTGENLDDVEIHHTQEQLEFWARVDDEYFKIYG